VNAQLQSPVYYFPMRVAPQQEPGPAQPASAGRRVYTASGRQKGSPRGYPNPCAGSGEILRRDAGIKDTSAEAVAAPAKERRWVRRHCQRLPLTMSVFNQGAVMQAELVSYGLDGICVEAGHRVLPGTSIHLRIDVCQAADVGKAILQGLRTTALVGTEEGREFYSAKREKGISAQQWAGAGRHNPQVILPVSNLNVQTVLLPWSANSTKLHIFYRLGLCIPAVACIPLGPRDCVAILSIAYWYPFIGRSFV
jgi:hypothetical protein